MITYLIFFGLLIFSIIAHELGHLAVALLCGIKITAFSIGFGKILWKKKIKGIEFRLSLLPFGGYCQPNEKQFYSTIYTKKFLILIAGAIVNLIIAMVCYYLNYKDINYGFSIDLLLYKFILLKDIQRQCLLLILSNANLFLLQFSLINLGTAIINLLPIPSLDGGQIVFIWLQKIWKKNFVKYYDRMNNISLRILILLQILFVYFYWIK